MTPERWKRVEDLFDSAAALAPAERSAFLSVECAGDSDVMAEVESLLRCSADATGFLEKPILELSATLPTAIAEGGLVPDALIGAQVGAYSITRRLGTGGMGVVYLAQQRSPSRVVALKLIRPGVASTQVLRRFEHEAQILGRLRHPGIAQIFEAGTAQTPQGLQPFFAMEYVVGEPLQEYAQRRPLDVRGRLALLIKLCDAVQHAHNKGVIHRDLKPGNILVDEGAPEEAEAAEGAAAGTSSTSFSLLGETVGQPKILDFGVARVTDADARNTTLRTEVGQIIGTLAYMSPEQVAPPGGMDAIDTRSDVYSLGVLAYQLLTGRLPCEVAGRPIHEAARIICESPPTRPGSVERAVRGEIETILLKALEKDPARRYQSAAALGEDLRRVLLNQPILARPASAAYQLRKLVVRHKLPFAALAGVFVLLAGFAVWMGFLYARADGLRKDAEHAWDEQRIARVKAEDNLRRAEDAEHLANRRAETATRIANVLTDALHAVNPHDSDSAHPDARNAVAAEIVDRGIRKIESELHDEPRMRAHILYHLGLTSSGLGQYTRAADLMRQAIELRRSTVDGPDQLVGTYLNSLASALRDMGKNTDAQDAALEALQIFRALLPEDSPYIADTLNTLATAYAAEGRIAEAERLLLESAELHQRIPGHRGTVVAESLNRFAGTLVDRGDYVNAEEVIRHCIALLSDDPVHSPRLLTSLRHNVGWVLCMQGRYEEAEEEVRWALQTREKQFAEGHERTSPELLTLGLILTRTGRAAQGEPYLRKSLALRQRAMPDNKVWVGEAVSALGECLCVQARYDEAQKLLLPSLQTITSEIGTDLETAQLALARVARYYELVGQPVEAQRHRALLREPWSHAAPGLQTQPFPRAAPAAADRPERQ